jgi:PhnB protein
MQLTNYLFFDGQCKAAFGFYEQALRGRIDMMLPASEGPGGDAMPTAPGERIMHARLTLGDQMLMGSDWMAERPFESPQGFFVSLSVDTAAEAERVFAALAEGGQVRTPLETTFFAARFGMLVDRFGIPWMVNCEETG